MNDTVQIPVEATYRIIKGKAVCLSAEYVEMGSDDFAQWMADALCLQSTTSR